MAPTQPVDIVPFDAAEHLKDEKSIAACLNASREMNDPAVLRNALSTVARARSMTGEKASTRHSGPVLSPGMRPSCV